MSDIDVNIENQHSAHKNAINEKIEKIQLRNYYK